MQVLGVLLKLRRLRGRGGGDGGISASDHQDCQRLGLFSASGAKHCVQHRGLEAVVALFIYFLYSHGWRAWIFSTDQTCPAPCVLRRWFVLQDTTERYGNQFPSISFPTPSPVAGPRTPTAPNPSPPNLSALLPPLPFCTSPARKAAANAVRRAMTRHHPRSRPITHRTSELPGTSFQPTHPSRMAAAFFSQLVCKIHVRRCLVEDEVLLAAVWVIQGHDLQRDRTIIYLLN